MANLKNMKVSRISYDAIREKASTTSGNVMTASFTNLGATATAAPYLPKVVAAGEVDLDAHCQTFVNKTSYSFEQARFFWNALMESVAEVLNDGDHTSLEFGYWRFALEVAGSVPSANSAPTAENPVWIAVYPSAELQAVAASIETQPNLASQPFQIKEVFGADHTPNRVQAGTVMLVMGVDLTMGEAGSKVELAKGLTVKQCAYVPREGDLNTRIRAKAPYGTPKGKGYQLRVTAKGKNGTSLTTIVKDNIEVAPQPTPTITKIASTGAEGILKTKAFEVTGTNFPEGQSVTSKMKWTEGNEAKEANITPTSVTETKMTYEPVAALNLAPDNTELTYELTVDGVTVTKKVTLLPAPQVPIYTSTKGGIKVTSAMDSYGNALPDGTLQVKSTDNVLVFKGVGVEPTSETEPTTGITKVYFEGPTGEPLESATTYDPATGEYKVSLGMDASGLTPGLHNEMKYSFFCYTEGQTDSLTIPLKLNVELP